MGIATPQSGQIAFSDINVGILNAGSTAQLDMNTAAVRLGYGSTSQVSISNLRGATGGVVTIAYRAPAKFVPGGYGYDSLFSPQAGSATGITYRPAPESTFLYQIFDGEFDTGTTSIGMWNADFSSPPAGWQGTNVTRAALGDGQRTINTADSGGLTVAYTMPTSGTTTWGLKFG